MADMCDHDNPDHQLLPRGYLDPALLPPGVQVQRAAQLEHIPDVHAVFKDMEEKLREQQGAPDRTAQESALLTASELLDTVVKEAGRWDVVRPQLAAALEEAGLTEAAQLASCD